MFRIKTKNGQIEISKEIVVVLIMDLFAAAYAVSARELSGQSLMFPGFLLIGILLFSIMCIRQSIHFRRGPSAEAEGEEVGFGVTGKLVAYVALVLAMLVGFSYLGAVVSIFLFLLLTMLVLGVRNKIVLILVPVITDAFVYAVFKMWLAIPLPAGILEFIL